MRSQHRDAAPCSSRPMTASDQRHWLRVPLDHHHPGQPRPTLGSCGLQRSAPRDHRPAPRECRHPARSTSPASATATTSTRDPDDHRHQQQHAGLIPNSAAVTLQLTPTPPARSPIRRRSAIGTGDDHRHRDRQRRRQQRRAASSARRFTVDVGAVNQRRRSDRNPALTAPGSRSSRTPLRRPSTSRASPPAPARRRTLTVTATSSNPAVDPQPRGRPTPAPTPTGYAHLHAGRPHQRHGDDHRHRDGQRRHRQRRRQHLTQTFTVTVTPVNQPPTFNRDHQTPATILENKPRRRRQPDGHQRRPRRAREILTVTATSSNPR